MIESTKSIIFIASLHVSFKNTCKLNVLLCELVWVLLLLVVLCVPFFAISNINCLTSECSLISSEFCLTNIIINSSFLSCVSMVDFMSSSLIQFLECFHKPERVLKSFKQVSQQKLGEHNLGIISLPFVSKRFPFDCFLCFAEIKWLL